MVMRVSKPCMASRMVQSGMGTIYEARGMTWYGQGRSAIIMYYILQSIRSMGIQRLTFEALTIFWGF